LATKKEKYLESAQKFILKGQIDRAIKDYEQAVALDPKDIRCRQRLAELMVRVNRKDDAIAEYEMIGKYYADNSYYLKAIAVYKQIQKLDPTNINVTLTLASLNEKQGLIGNALAEYDQVYSHYMKEMSYVEALKVIDKMISADPENLATHLKQAETEFTAGKTEQAYASFLKLLQTLVKRDNGSSFAQISARVKTLFPEKKEVLPDLAASLVQEGAADGAVELLQKYLGENDRDLRAWRLLDDAGRMLGDHQLRAEASRQMLRLFPDDLEVKETAVGLAVEQSDAEGALEQLFSYRQAFVAAAAWQALERLYEALQTLLPHDLRVLTGLEELYQACGDEAKLAVVSERIAALGRDVLPAAAVPAVVAESLAPEQRQPYPEPGPAPHDRTAVPPEASDADYGDLDLPDFDEIVPAGSDAATAAVGGMADDVRAFDFGSEPASGDDVSGDVQPEEAMEWEEELDLSFLDDDAVPAPVAAELPGEFEWVDESPAQIEGGAARVAPEIAEAAGDELPEFDAADLDLAVVLEEELDFEPALTSGAVRLEEQVAEGDAETHYSLGIAYKEMGLYDEAIAEMRLAATSPQLKFSSVTLQGICYREKGDITMAETIFRRAVELPGISSDESVGLKYELALLYEDVGRVEDAIRLYREVCATDRGFRDAAAKIAALQGGAETAENYDLDLVEVELEELE
jgi:tetratricopeptide (TPR) repeat protein